MMARPLLLFALALSAGCGASKPALLVYCAAVARGPMEEIAERYEAEHGVRVELLVGGSNTLLGKAKLSGVGDLLLVADASYADAARERGLVDRSWGVVQMNPALIVHRHAADRVRGIDDLASDGLRLALANPDTAALGRVTKQALERTGGWAAVKQRVERSGVFAPTAPATASAFALGAVDAAVVWRPQVHALNTPDSLVEVPSDELDRRRAMLVVAPLSSSKRPAAAEVLTRFVAGPSRGGAVFERFGFELPLVAIPGPAL